MSSQTNCAINIWKKNCLQLNSVDFVTNLSVKHAYFVHNISFVYSVHVYILIMRSCVICYFPLVSSVFNNKKMLIVMTLLCDLPMKRSCFRIAEFVIVSRDSDVMPCVFRDTDITPRLCFKGRNYYQAIIYQPVF